VSGNEGEKSLPSAVLCCSAAELLNFYIEYKQHSAPVIACVGKSKTIGFLY